MKPTLRAASILAALTALTAVLSGCIFVEQQDDHAVRGYTECGDFGGGETCSPGQYCADPGFSECSLGCLSDVNCASNQVCFKEAGRQVGVCTNATPVATRVGGLLPSSDVGGAADAGSPDVVGGDAGP